MSATSVDTSRFNRHMAFDPSKRYNGLPALPPQVDVESRAVLKACITARGAVAELKAAGQLIPNQGVPVNSIPLLEAQASSEIENIVTTTDQMFLFDGISEGHADPATQTVASFDEHGRAHLSPRQAPGNPGCCTCWAA